MRLLITGGSGFIGSAVVRYLIADTTHDVLNIDKLTYAASPEAVASCAHSPRYHFQQIDICQRAPLEKALFEFEPDAVLHLAAESHVDRSIDSPAEFLQTNFMGTYNLLQCALKYWQTLPASKKTAFRFNHVSTDEVYGSLGPGGLFTEQSQYQPNSPYSASKAASDHLARAWHHTYGLPITTTNCSNNYGAYQFPEKLIPLMVIRGSQGQSLPVYGSGANIRDWLHVDDHVSGLLLALSRGKPGETYNLGGNNERTNLRVVETIADILDELKADQRKESHRQLIQFVDDRPGHDLRYAIDSSKAQRELGWKPNYSFDDGLRKTVAWYLEHQDWWQAILKNK